MKNKTNGLLISAILIVLIAASSMLIWNGNIGADVFAKYSNNQEQNQLNDCQVGIVGGANCAINAVQTQADGTVSSPVISQASDASFDRNNINIRSAVNQQNSGDTSSSGSSGDTNGGNGCGDCSAENDPNNGNGDLGAENTIATLPEQEFQPVENMQGTNTDPFILPFNGN